MDGVQRDLRDRDSSQDQELSRCPRCSGATLFRGAHDDAEVFEPLTPALSRLHASLKRVFDPQGVLNPGRMYRDF